MAFYIDLEKISETDQYAQYKFTSEDNVGIVQIEKASGDVIEIAPAIKDRYKRLFERAALSLMKHWKKGEYPKTTFWAS